VFVGYFWLYQVVLVKIWIWSCAGYLVIRQVVFVCDMDWFGVSKRNLVFLSHLFTVRGSCVFFFSYVQGPSTFF